MAFAKDNPILLIDDFALAREVLRKPLTTIGLNNILEASSGSEGLKILNEQYQAGKPVGLVICDLNMPGMTGLELLKTLRGQEEFKSLPFVMLTVETNPQIMQQVSEAGALDYLVKPFVFATISKKLNEILTKLEA